MSYFNYHAEIKKLIKSKHLLGASFFKRYNHISPALVLYFDNHRPMPIREYKWPEYLELLSSLNVTINEDNTQK